MRQTDVHAPGQAHGVSFSQSFLSNVSSINQVMTLKQNATHNMNSLAKMIDDATPM